MIGQILIRPLLPKGKAAAKSKARVSARAAKAKASASKGKEEEAPEPPPKRQKKPSEVATVGNFGLPLTFDFVQLEDKE